MVRSPSGANNSDDGLLPAVSSTPVPSITEKSSSDNAFRNCGIRLSYLTQGIFWEDCQIIKSTVAEWTTQRVCEEIILPQTQNCQSSYCDVLIQNNNYGNGRPRGYYVGSTANLFVSHAHCNNFLQLIETLEQHFAVDTDEDPDEIILWLDLFSMNQHLPMDWNFEWLSTTFRAAIQDIGRTVMVMSPWKAPVPFQRAWCIYEAFCTIQTDAKLDLDKKAGTASIVADDSISSRLEIAMNPCDRRRFMKDILDGDPYATMNDIWTTIRSKHSVCSKVSDQERIFKAIKKGGGFHNIDTVVLARYRKWVLHVTLAALREHEDDGFSDHSDDAHADAAAMLRWTIGILYKMQGMYGPAEEFLETSMKMYQERRGLEYSRSLDVMNTLGRLYELQNRKEDAEKAYQDCLQRRLKLLGPTHPQTLDSVNNLALLYGCSYGDRLEDAKALCKLCLKQRRVSTLLGEDHPDTITSARNLATLYFRQAQQNDGVDEGHQDDAVDKAEELFRHCLARRLVLLGEDHPDTIHSMNDLAGLCLLKGNTIEAAKLYHECYHQRRAILGDDHRETLHSLHNLALVHSTPVGCTVDTSRLRPTTGELHKKSDLITVSENLFRECMRKQTALLGANHADTLNTMFNLALQLEREGRYHETSALLEDCLERRIGCLGEEHPDTLLVMRQLTTLDEKIKFRRGRQSQTSMGTNATIAGKGVSHRHASNLHVASSPVGPIRNDFSDQSDDESVQSIISRASTRSEPSASCHSIGSRTITSRASRHSHLSRESNIRRAKSSVSIGSTSERSCDQSAGELSATPTARTVETTANSSSFRRDSLSSRASGRSFTSSYSDHHRKPRRRVSIVMPIQGQEALTVVRQCDEQQSNRRLPTRASSDRVAPCRNLLSAAVCSHSLSPRRSRSGSSSGGSFGRRSQRPSFTSIPRGSKSSSKGT